MSMVFRAEDEPVISRVDYWRHLAEETVVPLELRVGGSPDFSSRIRTGSIGAVQVTEMTAPPAQAARTDRLIRRSDPELCKLDVVAHGSLVVEQDGRQASLGPGDLSFVDLSRPARWANSAARVVAVLFPRALLPLRLDESARLTGIRIAGDRGTGALVARLARQLPGQLDACEAADGARLGTAVVDLLTVALAARIGGGRQPPPGTPQALVTHIHTFIEQRLADPGLTPEEIAAAHHISVRYLYRLFEPQGHSVAGWIRRRRLERCRRDLLDPALQGRPVSAIAARWGLADAAHFSRAFRAAYGVPPSEYRRQGAPGR
jgi:AraC-like DNA-binding protein